MQRPGGHQHDPDEDPRSENPGNHGPLPARVWLARYRRDIVLAVIAAVQAITLAFIAFR
jgi:hypothetical protein